MAREKLTDKKLKSIKEPGRYADGGGLYLRVREGSTGLSKTWVLLAQIDKKRRELSLGPYGTGAAELTLAAARKAAQDQLAVLQEDARAESLRATSRAAGKPTFGKLVEMVLPDIVAGYRNAIHRKQWESTLQTYAASLWDKQIDAISADDVLEVLRPIWMAKEETASRLRGRLDRIFKIAIARRYRSDNPAILDLLLPQLPRQSGAVKSHAALPYQEIPLFFASELGRLYSMSADAVRFLILTAARTGEVRGATWREFDFYAETWTVPASRMKAGREHVVPLVPATLSLLRRYAPRLEVTDPDALVFPSRTTDGREKPLSENGLLACVKGLRQDITAHGFRSTFRDWCGDETEFAREVVENCLAHSVGSAVERAYRRSTALEKRREVLLAWSRYCLSEVQGAGGACI